MVSDAAPDVPDIPCPRIVPLIIHLSKGIPGGFEVLNASMLHDIMGLLAIGPFDRDRVAEAWE